MTDPILFAPLASREFGERVAAALGTALSPMEEREFEGGEHKTRPLVSVRGQRVFVLQSLSGDAAAARTTGSVACCSSSPASRTAAPRA